MSWNNDNQVVPLRFNCSFKKCSERTDNFQVWSSNLGRTLNKKAWRRLQSDYQELLESRRVDEVLTSPDVFSVGVIDKYPAIKLVRTRQPEIRSRRPIAGRQLV